MELFLNKLSKDKLLHCMNTLGYIKQDQIIDGTTIDDINTFWTISKKEKNDSSNKLRESIINNILNGNIPESWYTTKSDASVKWVILRNELNEFVKKINRSVPLKQVFIKAGRNYNYDFSFIFENNETKFIEFKYNVDSIDKYPEIMSLSSNNFVKGIIYPEFFYDNYLTNFENLPSREFYLKNIHKNSVNHPFFINLKQQDNLKPASEHSINIYLQEHLIFDFDKFKLRLQLQFDKIFMLWKDGKMYMDKLTSEDIDIVHELTLKSGKNGFNTVIIKSHSSTVEYHLLLRWKNHIGVLYPAWQVKLVRKLEK